MGCSSSLGFSSLAFTGTRWRSFTLLGFFLIQVIFASVIISNSYSDKLTWISSIVGNRSPPLFAYLQRPHSSNAFTNLTHHYAPMARLESAMLFSREQQVNRLKRRNKPKSRRIEQSPRVVFRNITAANKILHPVQVFHRPGGEGPYIVELYVVVDEKFVSSFSHDVVQIVTRVNSIFQAVNGLFAQFNVQLIIVGLEIWEKNRVNLEAEEHFLKTLASFKRTEVNVRHDCLFALLGDTDQASNTRGRANREVMCKHSSCVSFVRDSQYMEVNETARTAAHELGHNFGLRHDTENCECQGCIMATGVEFGTATTEWSPCSIRDMPNLLHYGMGACLHDVPVHSHTSLLPRQTRLLEVNGPSVIHTYTAMNTRRGTPELFQSTPTSLKRSLCGNGKLDPGEECDCGTADTCPKEVQACCDVKTCSLLAGAECATGPCCDIQSAFGDPSHTICKLKQSGSVCREAGNSCDLPEYCDGGSEWCPADVFKTDGEVCYTKEGYKSHCIRGGCNAPDEWCRVLWGPTGTAAGPGCVAYNMMRDDNHAVDKVANCGRLRPRGDERWREMDQWPSKACSDWADAECGRLWCTHRNEKAMLLGWQEQQPRMEPHSQRTCVALVYDPPDPLQHSETTPETGFFGPGWGDAASVTQDAGMTPDGTPCQRGLCYNGTCIRRDQLPFRKMCNCNYNGVCNNLGHCHCNIGYAPPDCTESGNGGSVDSGPPPPSWHEYGFIFAICFIVFVLCPAFLLCMYCLLCRCRKRRLIFPKSGPLPPPSSYGERFDWGGFFNSIWQCCRECKPYFDNDPPIIVAFGPPDSKDLIKVGHIFTTSGNSSLRNGHSRKATTAKLNGNALHAVAYPVATNEPHGFSPETFRRELMQEFSKGSKKPGFLRDLETAWEAAERETGTSKNSSLGSLTSGSGSGGVRVEISSPRLENTTFKGETRSLALAARIQQQQRTARRLRLADPSISKTTVQGSHHPISSIGGISARTKQYPTTPSGPAKPDISAPTLQTSTYKHDLVELPEAYSTLKNPKKG
uniref:Subfamily M12B unassigned peptidase n=1 Tax=Echinococcus granulosus TaxID=6210 RepID=A0A068WBY2_ECHGR|nr:subfamily M12B unassigned peptidase [Echinococcus granulosus]